MNERVHLSADQKIALVAAARSFIGAKWRHQGRRPEFMDCIGLAFLSFRAIGVEMADEKGYGRTPHNKRLRAGMVSRLGDPAPLPLQPGDVVTMRWNGEEMHVGIVTDHPDGLGLIHCSRPHGGVIEHRLTAEWADRIVEAWR